MARVLRDVSAFGGAVAVLVGSCVMWAPLWWAVSDELPARVGQILIACAVSLVGGLASYRSATGRPVIRALCAAGGLALAWLAWIFSSSSIFGEIRAELTVLGVLIVGAIGMFVHAARPAMDPAASASAGLASADEVAE